jgi:hypothetical protein
LTQMCVNSFIVLKVSPPLVMKEGVETMHSSAIFCSEALGLAKRVMAR